MELLLPELIDINRNKINEIDDIVRSIYRLIIFSRKHSDDDLLDSYLAGMHNLKELVGIKNAQMESQNEEEAEAYLKNLRVSLDFVIEEIQKNNNFESQLQLFQLLRLISPETNTFHPNKYRFSQVQVGYHVCPPPRSVPKLVSELFFRLTSITNPILKAIYFHHELIRIHPFADGNGRVTRIAKNWMLMYNLYPPIFINDAYQKTKYIHTLDHSFRELARHPNRWNTYTFQFFEQELDRKFSNACLLYESINRTGLSRPNSI